MTILRCGLILLCLAGAMRTAASAEVLEIEPRAGVFLRMLIELPPEAKAIAMLFPGGKGIVRINADGSIRGTTGNSLTRSRNLFAAGGIGTALVDAPSDRWNRDGLTYAYRMSAEHMAEIGQAIAALRERYPELLVWLVGTSRGTLDAAGAAAGLADKGPDGLVLTASIGASGKQDGTVLDFALERIAIPTLLVHHLEDECAVTPPAGAGRIRSRLTGTPTAALILVDGGDSGHGRTCGATTPHGFLGIEHKVVAAIAAWIADH